MVDSYSAIFYYFVSDPNHEAVKDIKEIATDEKLVSMRYHDYLPFLLIVQIGGARDDYHTSNIEQKFRRLRYSVDTQYLPKIVEQINGDIRRNSGYVHQVKKMKNNDKSSVLTRSYKKLRRVKTAADDRYQGVENSVKFPSSQIDPIIDEDEIIQFYEYLEDNFSQHEQDTIKFTSAAEIDEPERVEQKSKAEIRENDKNAENQQSLDDFF